MASNDIAIVTLVVSALAVFAGALAGANWREWREAHSRKPRK